jgi:hypothetical protein
MKSDSKPVTSTTFRFGPETPVTHTVDTSSSGVIAWIRLGDWDNDLLLLARTPEDFERIADHASRAAAHIRQALLLRQQLQVAGAGSVR